MVEKSQNIVGPKLTEGEPINRLAMPFGEVLQQNTESVAVGLNRKRADVALGAKMIGKETFDENGEWIGSHRGEWLDVWFCWNRRKSCIALLSDEQSGDTYHQVALNCLCPI
jgi:hypothetical protein